MIGTFNVENIKTDHTYTLDLLHRCKLLCLQEHWLWGIERDKLQELFPGYGSVIKYCDDSEPYLIRHNRRGHAGVAVICDRSLDPIIQPEMEEGNERIIVIGIGDHCTSRYSTVIINAYLPSGSTVTEIEQNTLKMQRLSGLVI